MVDNTKYGVTADHFLYCSGGDFTSTLVDNLAITVVPPLVEGVICPLIIIPIAP